MNALITKDNLTRAGAATVAVMLALNFTAGKGKLLQGGAAFAAAAAALVLASKI